jgi:hypothetical protein
VFKNSLISLFPYTSSEEKHDVYSLSLLFLGACLSKCCMADASFLEQGMRAGCNCKSCTILSQTASESYIS